MTPPSQSAQPHRVARGVLIAANRGMTAAELARGFKRGGKGLEARVARALVKLTRYGRVSASANGAFTARRAA